MDSRQKWFFTALVGGAGAYLLVDANDSVRNLLSVLTFFVVAMYGEAEIDKERLKELNDKQWQKVKALEGKLEALQAEMHRKK